MFIINKRLFNKLLVGLISVFALVVGIYTGVWAAGYSGTVYGRAAYHGYFTNRVDYYGVEVLPPISGGLAIPNSVNTVSELINLLKNANRSSSSQRINGSAFIVNTMLGRNAPGEGGRSVSNADFDRLQANLKARDAKNKIKWNINISQSINSYYQSSNHDDAFYSDYRSESGIKIINDDGSAYYLLRRCANPMGRTGGVQDIPKWNVTPSTSVIPATATPGVIIRWTHKIKNTGPDKTTALKYDYINGQGLGTANGPNHDVISIGNGGERSFNSTWTVTSADVGKNLCRATRVWPNKWNDSSVQTSGYKCVLVTDDQDYNLTPSATVTPSAIEAGSPLTVSSSITNSGSNASNQVNWELKADKGSFSKNGIVASISPGTWNNSNFTDTDTDFPVGTHICFTMSATPHSNTDTGTVTSPIPEPPAAPVCAVIGKVPKTQILGGDLIVSGAVTARASVKNGYMFGSWAEYGIIASGGITGAASGAAFSRAGLPGATLCGYSPLSFSNTPQDTANCTGSVGSIGYYSNTTSMPDVAASFPGGTPIAVGSVTPNNLSGTYTAGNLTLNESNLSPGKSVIIKASGTVTIAGKQTYSNGSYTKVSQLPQLVIIAKNIVINESVTNVDAWLIATSDDTSSIKTCDKVGSTQHICKDKLTVNGPVMTNHLYLYRTAGSGIGGHSGDPAEVFNLPADAYLWAFSQASDSERIRTVYTTELPPRF